MYPNPMKLAILSTALLLAPAILMAQQPTHDGMTIHPAQTGDAMPMKAPVPPSHSLTVTFQGRLTTLSIEDLLALPQVTVHVHNAHRNTDEQYTGPLVSDVLAKAGLSPAHENEQAILHSAVIATATDHYFVVYSAAELEPAFTTGQSIIAVMKSGLPDTEGGLIQLINANAAKPARWVHGLTNLNIMAVQQHQ
jgi:hypothetical protein